jgi:hypothetical protein
METPRVHVYVTKGSRKAEREVQAPGGAVKVEIDRVGRVVVRPEMASGVSNRGNVFTHKNRLACGSSCAPSSERYAGTLGALVRKRSGAAMYVLSNNHVLAACNHVPVGMPIVSPASMDAWLGLNQEFVLEFGSRVPGSGLVSEGDHCAGDRRRAWTRSPEAHSKLAIAYERAKDFVSRCGKSPLCYVRTGRSR